MRTEDGYIIHRCLNGDSNAFGFLVDKYKAGVYAFAYERLHNFHDAEDIDTCRSAGACCFSCIRFL